MLRLEKLKNVRVVLIKSKSELVSILFIANDKPKCTSCDIF